MNARWLHMGIAVIWLTLAAVLCIGLAWLGNEEQIIARQRGEDNRTTADLQFRHERLLSEIEWRSGEAHLRQAVRKLQLPLTRPASLAQHSLNREVVPGARGGPGQ